MSQRSGEPSQRDFRRRCKERRDHTGHAPTTAARVLTTMDAAASSPNKRYCRISMPLSGVGRNKSYCRVSVHLPGPRLAVTNHTAESCWHFSAEPRPQQIVIPSLGDSFRPTLSRKLCPNSPRARTPEGARPFESNVLCPVQGPSLHEREASTP